MHSSVLYVPMYVHQHVLMVFVGVGCSHGLLYEQQPPAHHNIAVAMAALCRKQGCLNHCKSAVCGTPSQRVHCLQHSSAVPKPP
jgi:hypothetical protein